MIRGDSLAGWLERARSPRGKGLAPVTWIAGDEPLLVLEAADAVRASARSLGFEERMVITVERTVKPERLAAETGAMSLFAARRLIELRLGGKPARDWGEAVAKAAASLDETTRILVTSPRLDRASTESAWFGRLDETSLVVTIAAVERPRLAAWIAERLSLAGQSAQPETLALIAQRTEGNLLAAHQEIQKLALLLPPGPLAHDAVRAAVLDVARYDVFDLVEACLAADPARAVRTLQGLAAEGSAPPMVIWALADALRTLWRLLEAQARGRPVATVARELRLWGDRERLYGRALGRLTAPGVRALLRETALADKMAKGLDRRDPWQALESIVLGLAGAPRLTEFEAQDAGRPRPRRDSRQTVTGASA